MEKKAKSLIVRNLHKSFRLPHERHSSLKQAVLNLHKRRFENFHVLKKIDFEVNEGEFFGIVGRNGSGKSTLLKLIAGIYVPSSGSITVNGRLTPFIELGVGFNQELTGRDNIFLNGAILGLSTKEIKQKYHEIVAFAELERFMDQKLKNYSSGMQVRLAFSVAIQAKTGILLLDEVLAVGDSNFQKKCFDVFKDIKKRGRTVILVTHDMGAVQNFCDRAMLIDSGEIVAIGKSGKVAQAYNELNLEQNIKSEQKTKKQKNAKQHGGNEIKIVSCESTLHGRKQRIFKPNQKIGLRVIYKATATIDNPIFGITVKDLMGRPLFATNSKAKKQKTGVIKPGQTVTVEFEMDNILSDGTYTVSPAVANESATIFYDWIEEMTKFDVSGWDFPAALLQPAHELTIKKD